VIGIVLDTNVLVSGLLSEMGPPGQIVDLVLAGEIQLACDTRILAEYRDVLARPELGIDQSQSEEVLRYIEQSATVVTTQSWPEPLPDPDDEAFLCVAEISKALCLVTGNVKHFPARARRDVRVLTPRQFMDSFQTD
jgi:putative PIN family toxin of toxin-antitoxin system